MSDGTAMDGGDSSFTQTGLALSAGVAAGKARPF